MVDLVERIQTWFDDAAGRKLVRHDDPHEPIVVGEARGFAEGNTAWLAAEASKHNGWFVTASRVLKPPGTEKQRIIVGAGDIPTVVAHQPCPQEAICSWEPETFAEMLEIAKDFRLNDTKLRYWVAKQTGRKGLAVVVFGVVHPRQVFGRTDNMQWVALVVTRTARRQSRKAPRSDAYSVRAFTMRDQLTPAFAARLSGNPIMDQPKKVVVIGTGSLGAGVCESLGRSGLAELHLVDHDALYPHNLARHVLPADDVGRYKAEALADRLNALFADSTVARAHRRNFLDLTDEELGQLLQGAYCVVDLSASPAVQRRVSDLTRPRPPALCAFQILGGRGTVLLAENSGQGGEPIPLDAVEATLVAEQQSLPLVQAWLGEEPEPINIGGGCRSMSTQVPDSLVRFGAAWVAEIIIAILRQNEWPGLPLFGVLSSSPGTDALGTANGFTREAKVVGMGQGAWTLWIAAAAIQKARDLSLAAASVKSTEPEETCGILVGEVDRRRRVIYVTDTWEPPPDTSTSASGCTRGRRGLLRKLLRLQKETGGRCGYVGEWHSHPSRPAAPSVVDHEMATDMAAKLSVDQRPALCLITNGSEETALVVEE